MTRAQVLDILERAVWTFFQAFIGFATIGIIGYASLVSAWANNGGAGDFPSPNVLGLALLGGLAAGIAAGVSVIKGAVAVHFGNGSAGTLPTSVDPEPVVPNNSDVYVVSPDDEPELALPVDEVVVDTDTEDDDETEGVRDAD